MKHRVFNRYTNIILIISFIISLFLMIITHASLFCIIRGDLEGSASIFTKSLSENIYQNSDVNEEIILNSNRNPNHAKIILKILEFIKDYPAVQINIYNKYGDKIISSNESVIDKHHANEDYDINVLLDSIASRLIPNDFSKNIYSSLKGDGFNHVLISTKVDNKVKALFRESLPIIVKNKNDNDQIIGVSEIYYDISDQLVKLANLRMFLMTIISLLFLISYVLIRNNLLEVKKLIYQQSEEIEELNQDNREVRKESQEKSEFLANTSHELRTPLNAIIGFSEIISMEEKGAIDNILYKEYAADINASGKHLLSLINDILDYSKASSNKLEVESVDLNVSKLITSSLRLVIPKVESLSIKLEKEIPDKSLVMKADPKRLKQCILNLLSNAIKFTPEGGIITISAYFEGYEDNKFIVIEIKDTGIGIADKDLTKAMSSFGQVDSKLNRQYEGTGIGLPFTKKLVELMKGEFSIKSKVGEGTIVSIKFIDNSS